MRTFIVIVLIFIIASCVPYRLPPPVRPGPVHNITPYPNKILLLSTCDVPSKKYRDNKEELFIRFIDSVKVVAAQEIESRRSISTQVIKGQSRLNNRDSSIYSLIKQHNATHAIVIESFDVFFDQMDVKVTKTSTGKDREAFYDIVSEIDFSLYNTEELLFEKLMKTRQYHSSRAVLSGLLAAGPNVVVQRKDAWAITLQNLENYLDLFYEFR